MKKIMTAAIVALGAVFAQGAMVAWNITNVSGPSGSALGTGTAYVFFVQGDAKADTSAWAALVGKGATELTSAVADANFSYKHSDITATAGTWTYAATTAGSAKTNSELGLSGSTKYSVYAVIFDSETITDSSKFMVTTATAASTTYSDTAGTTKSYSIGNQTSTSRTWYAVSDTPEPTSGLLMLLGMAGLALKRKRA